MTVHDPAQGGAEIVAEHMAECTDAQAALVVDGNADEVIAGLLAAGWTLSDRAEFIAGKRIRFLRTPAGQTLAEGTPAVKDVYLLVKALVPGGVTQAEVRDAAAGALNIPPDCNPDLDWTWDVAISERGTPEDPAVTERAREWDGLLRMLAELDAAGALDGIRAIISERLRQVRGGATAESDRDLTSGELVTFAHRRMLLGKLRQAAALLAAEIDREGTS